jgi:hypothetical protein
MGVTRPNYGDSYLIMKPDKQMVPGVALPVCLEFLASAHE